MFKTAEVQIGVMNSAFEENRQCKQSAVDDAIIHYKDKTNCTEYLDVPKLKDNLLKDC